MSHLKTVMMCLGVSFLTACAHTPQKILDELIIKNSSNTEISNVKLKDSQNSQALSCNIILPGYDCSIGFSPIENKDHDASLTWMQNGQTYQQQLPKNPDTALHPNTPNKAVVTILDGGQLTLHLD